MMSEDEPDAAIAARNTVRAAIPHAVLPAHRYDMRAGTVVRAVEKERREVFASVRPSMA